jgi:predicted PurR-regulated permease PerM
LRTSTEAGRAAWLPPALLGLVGAIAAVVVLRELRAIFIPFCFAAFLYFLFAGAVRRLLAWRIPKPLALAGVLAVIFCGLSLCGTLLFAGAASFVERFPTYSARAVALAEGALARAHLPWVDLRQTVAHIDWEKLLDPGRVTALVSGSIGSFAGFVGNLLLVLLLLMFLLAEKTPLAERVARALQPARADALRAVLGEVDSRVRHYLLIKTVMSAATAALAALILLAGGADFVVFTALLVFFLNFIPTFGSLLSTLFPALAAFLKFGFSPRFVLLTLGLMAMQFLMGNVLEPQVMGRSLNLSPIVILLALIFWGWLWGAAGMFLAVPVTSSARIVFESVPALRPLAAAMGSE